MKFDSSYEGVQLTTITQDELQTEESTTEYRRPRSQKINDLTRLARENESIVVRNTLSTISVLVIRVDGEEQISEFKPLGSVDGEDIMELPSTYLKNAQFRKQLQKGIYEIIDADDPDVLEAIEAQKRMWADQQATKLENDTLIARQQPQAFSGVECIAQEGRGTCTNFAIKANTNERPPLCSTHAYLSAQFTPEETGKFVDGKPEVRWNRIQFQTR